MEWIQGLLDSAAPAAAWDGAALAAARTMGGMDMRSRIDAALAETGLSNEKLEERLAAILAEAGLEPVGVGAESVRTWRNPARPGRNQPMPNAVALYALARLTGRPMRWFVDGIDDAPRPVGDDEILVLRAWRAFGLSAEEALRRLAGLAPAGAGAAASAPPDPAGEADPSGFARAVRQRVIPPAPRGTDAGEPDPLEQDRRGR